MTIGILLINLGTPEKPTEEAVREYLDVFLCDPYVITLPTFLRHFLVRKLILPKRSISSAEAYQKIWTANGSPLLVNSLALKDNLQAALGEKYKVALGMRYSKPSISEAIVALNDCEEIIVMPLFPQFARATSQSALDVALAHTDPTKTRVISDFYDQSFYIDALAMLVKKYLKDDHAFLLMSYHGLPKRQKDSENYRTQCYKTSALLVEKLGLTQNQYFVSFQSRLGAAKWIQPYTEETLKVLRARGIENLAVMSPSFVADCIETLEEIDIRLREQWIALGGKQFSMIPCLNAEDFWVNELALYLSTSH